MLPIFLGEKAIPDSGQSGVTHVSIARSDNFRGGRFGGKNSGSPNSNNYTATLNLKVDLAYASALLPAPKQGPLDHIGPK